jgi:hypothetical protein
MRCLDRRSCCHKLLGAGCVWVLQWAHTEAVVVQIKSLFSNCHLRPGRGNNFGVPGYKYVYKGTWSLSRVLPDV